ncbi:helix-turn-helix transcriptional regulator [Anaerovibrio lipolyticus]|uniref:helix-turn-helix domain-containing protein n=1 Tax=Anaerovibrio lipolyticus TaxID=82374 RepID=UPI0023F0E929|nr:helix-turn-helix transcriptional regulator [Anaerovibrio lipolyticus]
MITDEDFRNLFRNNLQKQIAKKRCTQKEISNALGVSDSIVNQWIHGIKIPRMKNIDKLCAFFLCERSDLIEDRSTSAPDQELSDHDKNMVAAYNAAPEHIRKSVDTVLEPYSPVSRQDEDVYA